MQNRSLSVRVCSWLSFLLLYLLLASCGRGDGERQRLLLEDLDYFLHVMESSFCLYDVAYWARGTDINARVESIRAEILDNPNMSENRFLFLLSSYFNWDSMGAHFTFVDRLLYRSYMNYPDVVDSWRFTPLSHAVAREPHVQAFYDSRISFGEMQLMFRQVVAGVSRMIAGRGRPAEASIEEGRIAYLNMTYFVDWPHNFEDLQRYFDFFESIRGYEHLIIDITNHRGAGGNTLYFLDAIIRPIISEPHVTESFKFFRESDYNTEYIYRWSTWGDVNYIRTTNYRRPIAEILETYYLPEINLADMERLDYGFRRTTEIRPDRRLRFNFESAFDGKIWLLVDSYMNSSSEYAARIAKNMGFATLVGERTGGHLSGQAILVALPNTGILFKMDLFYVTDRYGRPWDAGTYPHHFTRPGLTALETALQLIEEGAY